MFIGKRRYLHKCKSLTVMTCHENTHPCFLCENRKPAKSDVRGYYPTAVNFINSIMRSKKYYIYIDIF